MKYVPIEFEIPVPVLHPFFWLILVAGAITLAAVLAAHWPSASLRQGILILIGKLPRLHERPMTNAFIWFALILSPVWLGLLALTIEGIFSLWLNGPPIGTNDPMAYRVHYIALVGLMTALAGLVGAPLAIHRLTTVERQTKAQEEGLITDRINKAVEGLGAEKTVSRVHRMISYQLRGDGFAVDQWYDVEEPPDIPEGASSIETTEWETITRTIPNLEVRIGAIYALERIAQDSLRDHIQIMEILCAYIRENAKVKDVKDSLPEPPEWFEGANDEGRWWKGYRTDETGAAAQGILNDWADGIRERLSNNRPRADIQTVLTVIGRRSRKQKEMEWGDWRPFEEAMPTWANWETDKNDAATSAYADLESEFNEKLRAWDALRPVFRLDLRATDLRGADMSGASQKSDFSVARFNNAILQGADFSVAHAQGADFSVAQAQGADFRGAQAQGADFFVAQAQCADFSEAQAQGADFSGAQAQGANFSVAQAQGADFGGAQAQGVDFSGAQAQGADFSKAQAQGANFREAQAQGADFFRAQFNAATIFTAAEFFSAAVKSCDFKDVTIHQDQVNVTFGDGSTELPVGVARPQHWPDWDMPLYGKSGFYDEMGKWKADKANYKPPPKPADEEPESD